MKELVELLKKELAHLGGEQEGAPDLWHDDVRRLLNAMTQAGYITMRAESLHTQIRSCRLSGAREISRKLEAEGLTEAAVVARRRVNEMEMEP